MFIRVSMVRRMKARKARALKPVCVGQLAASLDLASASAVRRLVTRLGTASICSPSKIVAAGDSQEIGHR